MKQHTANKGTTCKGRRRGGWSVQNWRSGGARRTKKQPKWPGGVVEHLGGSRGHDACRQGIHKVQGGKKGVWQNGGVVWWGRSMQEAWLHIQGEAQRVVGGGRGEFKMRPFVLRAVGKRRLGGGSGGSVSRSGGRGVRGRRAQAGGCRSWHRHRSCACRNKRGASRAPSAARRHGGREGGGCR